MTAEPVSIVATQEVESAGMSVIAWQAPAAPSAATALLPIMTVVLAAFLIIGLALPVLPLHVQQDLGLGSFAVGLWSGDCSDRRGVKHAVMLGLLAAVISGLLYFLSLHFAVRSLQC